MRALHEFKHVIDEFPVKKGNERIFLTRHQLTLGDIEKVLMDVDLDHALIYNRQVNEDENRLLFYFRDFLFTYKSIWGSSALLHDYPYEVNTLFPEEFDLPVEEGIQSIAIGWSEVRLNRDLHWGFRLIYFISLLVKELCEKTPIVLIIDEFSSLDRMNVFCLDHIMKLNIKSLYVFLEDSSLVIGESENCTNISNLHKNFMIKWTPRLVELDERPVKNGFTRFENSFDHEDLNSLMRLLSDSLDMYNLEYTIKLGQFIIRKFPADQNAFQTQV